MKRIHVISPYLSRFGGGVFTVVRELYNNKSKLLKKNSQFYIWGYKDKNSHEDCATIGGQKLLYKVRLRFINKICYSYELKKNLIKNIKKNDIIHLHGLWLYPSLLLKNSKKNNFKKIISTHGMLDSWALNNSRLKKNISLALYERKNLNSADCIHALCLRELTDIKKISPNVPIAVIPNGIYLPTIKIDKSQKKQIRRLLFLGRIHPKKGLSNLIKAWSEFSEVENWELVIAGTDENGYENRLKKLALECKISDSIRFIGPVFGLKKEELLLSADAFILPSFSEGLPMSILEAWSYKLPVIMTPECNLDLGFQKNAAIKIDSSTIGIRKGLSALLEYDETELVSKGENGYQLVKESFTWDIVSEKMEKLYLWLSNLSDKPDFVY